MQFGSLLAMAVGLLFYWSVALIGVLAGMIVAYAPRRRYLSAPGLALLSVVFAVALLPNHPLLSHSSTHLGIVIDDSWLRLLILVFGSVCVGLIPVPVRSPVRFERGALLLSEEMAKVLWRQRKRKSDRHDVSLAGWPISCADETKHFKLLGTTGTGKTTAICELLSHLQQRGDRAVVADPDGGYIRRFYDPKRGDLILNPFDLRSASWDVFGEMDAAIYADELARALIPDAEGSAQEWAGYARTFLSSVLKQLYGTRMATVSELYRLLLVAPPGELRLLLEGTPSQPFLEVSNERMFTSLRSVTANAVRGLEYVCAQEKNSPVAIRSWIREGRGVLFLPYQADQIAGLRALLAAWLRLAIFQTLSLPPLDDPAQRRLWFIVDELDALGRIDGLSDALARLRKFGGRCVLGFQSIAQVSTVYGQGAAQTLVENCANTLILRCSASDGGGTARFASRLIGDREVCVEQVTRSSSGSNRSRVSTSRVLQRRTEPALLPAQIEQLPDRRGYLKIASQAQWVPIELALSQSVSAPMSF